MHVFSYSRNNQLLNFERAKGLRTERIKSKVRNIWPTPNRFWKVSNHQLYIKTHATNKAHKKGSTYRGTETCLQKYKKKIKQFMVQD